MLCSVSYALWCGGGPERLTAATFVAGVAASATLGLFEMAGGFASVPVRLLAIDSAYAVVCILVALRANRLWTIMFAGCQLLAVLVHLARFAAPSMIPTSYAFLTVIWSWPMLILLVAGTLVHRRRLTSGRFVPDWKPFLRQRASIDQLNELSPYSRSFSSARSSGRSRTL